MATVNEKLKRVNETKPRFTVAEAARRLNVTRTHLSLVLHGHRQSRSLMNRYHLIRQQFESK